MKGYISVIDKRTQFLKELFINDGFTIVDYQKDLDFYFINQEEKPDCPYVFTFNDSKGIYVINNDKVFRHLNNTLTVNAFFMYLKKIFTNKKILVLGYGDLAKQLLNILKRNHNQLTVANRNYKDLAEIKKDFQHLDIHLLTGRYDYIINTIPNLNIDYTDVRYKKIYDLAQTRDMRNYVSLRNLPNLYFPYESALLMFCYIKDVMKNV